MISPDVLKSAAAVIPSAKGTLPPIQITTSTISSQAHLQMISHWHDELEFIYILDGKMDFHIEEKILTASRGDFLAIHASAMHRSAPHNGEDCRFIRALIHPSLLTEISPSETGFCLLFWEIHPAAVSISLLLLLTRRGWEGCCRKSIGPMKSTFPDSSWKASVFYTFSSPVFTPFPSRKADAGRYARYRYKRAAPDGRLYFPPLS